MLALDVRALWRAARAAPWSLWLLCLYMMFEYNRIQQIYPALEVVPWATLTIVACFVATLVEGIKPRRTYLMDMFVGAFFLWVVVSGVLAQDPGLAWDNWTSPVSWVLMYYLVTRIAVTPRRLLLFWLAFFLVHLKMSQAGTRSFVGRGFAFTDYGLMGGPGWFSNSGEFSLEMGLFVGMSLCFLLALRGRMSKLRLNFLIALLTGTALLTVIGSSSRGGQLGLAVELILLYLVLSKVRLRNVLIGAAILVIGWTLVPPEQKARFQTAGEDNTSQLRLIAWDRAWEATLQHPLTGLGFENWMPYYRALGGANETHNSVLEATSELGFPGLLFFFGALGTSFVMNARTRRRVGRTGDWAAVYRGMALGLDIGMVGFFIGAQFYSVLFYPTFWMSFAMTTALAETVRRGQAARGPRRGERGLPALRTLSRARRPVAVAPSPERVPAPMPFRPR